MCQKHCIAPELWQDMHNAPLLCCWGCSPSLISSIDSVTGGEKQQRSAKHIWDGLVSSQYYVQLHVQAQSCHRALHAAAPEADLLACTLSRAQTQPGNASDLDAAVVRLLQSALLSSAYLKVVHNRRVIAHPVIPPGLCSNFLIRPSISILLLQAMHIPTQHVPTQRVPTRHVPTQCFPTQHVPTQHFPTQHVPTQCFPTQLLAT